MGNKIKTLMYRKHQIEIFKGIETKLFSYIVSWGLFFSENIGEYENMDSAISEAKKHVDSSIKGNV